ncbi:hypothetical protein H6F46_13715 [Limnothrix sp. FACHB-1083]|uniref:hypothetical protein n=1 Tax=unclassified Limnothrix TaxID=2632864 RepID=UPI0016816491|nr:MULTISPECIES: hypothetical protein [unclassified Limnothrix]MBD2161750.1 hypothetical protein [Limnothrix sp. FACHB-1083]MBD2192673.1 hypothetical protein [Limnothrix sp. FACHB-1088]
MSIKSADYEEILATYSGRQAAIELLREYRPYLELLPSMRRPLDSTVVITLPLARIDPDVLEMTQLAEVADVSRSRRRHSIESERSTNKPGRQAVRLPCEIALLMCDPEWQVTTGVAVFVFVHRPNEDFYGLMSRWRQTQLLLDRDYEWVMPLAYRHVVGDQADRIYPLFLLSERSPERLQRGLKGATLPYVVCPTQAEPPARFDPQVDHTPAPTTDLTRETPHPGPGRSARDAQPTSDPELEGDLWVE